MRTLVFVVAMTLMAGPALAANPEQAANDLSSEIMSPFCPGVTLHECPSAEALRLRDRIESWFRDGMSRAAVLERLESEYGSAIRALPPSSGIGLIAWLMIAVATVAALVTGTILVRRWSGRAEAGPNTPIGENERRRVDDELARLRPQL